MKTLGLNTHTEEWWKKTDWENHPKVTSQDISWCSLPHASMLKL